jgi:mannosyltransferase OCH1-like enzyme
MDHFEIIPPTYNFEENAKTPVIPKILHMIWVGDKEQPEYVNTYKEQWQSLMPDWKVRLWTNEDINENEFPPDALEKIRNSTKGAQKADIMRYFFIYRHGGVYVDTDIRPCRSLDPIINMGRQVVACHDHPRVDWPYVAIGFFAAIPYHPLIAHVCRLALGATINTSDVNMHTGPRIFGDAIWVVKPEETYAMLHMFYFYRNLNGQTIDNNVWRNDDFEHRFGEHFYAASWFE